MAVVHGFQLDCIMSNRVPLIWFEGVYIHHQLSIHNMRPQERPQRWFNTSLTQCYIHYRFHKGGIYCRAVVSVCIILCWMFQLCLPPCMSTSSDIANNVKVRANHSFTRQNKNNNWLCIDYCQLKQLEGGISSLISLQWAWNSLWLVEITGPFLSAFKGSYKFERMVRSHDALHSRPLLKVWMVLGMHWGMSEQRKLSNVFHITSAHKGSLGLEK